MQKNFNFDSYLTPYITINTKWTIHTSIKSKLVTVKKIGEKFCNLGLGKIFLDMIPKV